MKKLIVVLILLFTVATFAYADTKTESTESTDVQLLQGKLKQCIGKLASEYTSTLRSLQMLQPKPQPTIDKEAKEKKK